MELRPPARRRRRTVALAAIAAALLAVAAGLVVAIRALGPEEIPEATHDDYCDAVHGAFGVTATAQDGGVLVTWLAMQYDETADFVVHRRPVGSTQWQRVAETTVSLVDGEGALSHLDTTPAEQPGTAYEYAVTHLLPDCGGESDPNDVEPGGPPTATPPQP